MNIQIKNKIFDLTNKDEFWQYVLLLDEKNLSKHIYLAAEGNWLDIVSYMLQNSEPDEYDLLSSLDEALINENEEIIKLLFEHPNFNPSCGKNNIVLCAAKERNFNLLEKIIEHPKFIDNPLDHHKETKHPHKRATAECMKKDKFDLLEKFLIKCPNTDYSFQDNYLLKTALQKGQEKIVTLLLENQGVKDSLLKEENFEILNERKKR